MDVTDLFLKYVSAQTMQTVPISGLCSNAFECPVVDAFASSAILVLHLFGIKWESNETVLLLLQCFFSLLVSSGISLRRISAKTFDCTV